MSYAAGQYGATYDSQRDPAPQIQKPPQSTEEPSGPDGRADEEDTPLLGQAAESTQQSKGRKWTFVVTLTPFNIIMAVGVVALAVVGSIFAALSKPSQAVNNKFEVGRLPFMGWNTWNAYHCEINETIILDNAKLIKSLGLLDAGYNYINIDDCYSEKERDSNGDIVASRYKSILPSVVI
ncbi:hypothetical protein NP233_g11560 [Leucocoprinus birnbaumii]|uniref:Alpha-galactosidase n=1 Tax=Leucocoprinus birnbaumii TaxID=56174 RepID=A0AAD5YNU8_9AGAR|nr:hypothetical protein NP233_g11560 [Leucocoprinus birnbaumii]